MTNLFPGLDHAGPKEHLYNVEKLVKSVDVPVFASLNAIYEPSWVEYAKELEKTGVAGLEINLYAVPGYFEVSGESIEDKQVQIVKAVKKAVSIPVSVKLSLFYTNPLNFIKKIDEAGADGFVLFNRFFQPEIDIETEEYYYPWELSNPKDHMVSLRYAGLLHGNVDGSVNVLLHHTFRYHDRILIIITIPRHESHQHVPAQGQLTVIGRGAIGDDMAWLHDLVSLDQGTLVDARVLVGALELGQGVDVGSEIFLALGPDPNDDPFRVHQIHNPCAFAHHNGAGVLGGDRLHTGADQRRLGADQRNRLALHVGAHESTVGIVILKERDQGSGDGNQLLRRDVDEGDILTAAHVVQAKLIGVPRAHRVGLA